MQNTNTNSINATNDKDSKDEDRKDREDVARHKRMYKDSSISSPYATKPMPIPKKIKLVSDFHCMECVCDYTGIVITIEVPRIEGHVFTYQNPLSIYANVKGMISRGPSYLKMLDTQVLAGLFITAYRHYDLLESYSTKNKLTGAAMNAMLRSAGKDILVEALDFVNLINSRNIHRLPALSLSYSAHKESVNLAPAIKEYIKLLRGILFPSSIPSKDKALIATVTEENMKITERNDLGKVLEKRSASITVYKGAERRNNDSADEELFKTRRKQAKELLAKIEDDSIFSTKLISIIRSLISNKNLVLMTPDMRSKIITKLSEKPTIEVNALIKIIRDSEPEDPFADAAEIVTPKETEIAVKSTVSQPVKMSAAERIAAILAAKQKKD